MSKPADQQSRPWPKTDPELLRLIEAAAEKARAMTPAERAEMTRHQRRSYVLAEASLGSDADEAAYAAAERNGDLVTISRLHREATARRAVAEAWLDQEGY